MDPEQDTQHDDENGDEQQSTLLQKSPIWSKTHLTSVVTICVAIFLLVPLTVLAHLLGRSGNSNLAALDNCGTTPSEARSRGCPFDILSFAWQTPDCYDHDNTEAFRTHNGTWSYFADIQGTRSRPEEEAMAGGLQTFVTAEYHFTHCTYMWRQLHRAYTIRGYIDDHLDNWNHTLHCQRLLLARPTWQMADVNTVGRIIYPKCRRIGQPRD